MHKIYRIFPWVELRRAVSRYLSCAKHRLSFLRVSNFFALELQARIIPHSLSNTLHVAQKR
jgi:hypothetical protein